MIICENKCEKLLHLGTNTTRRYGNKNETSANKISLKKHKDTEPSISKTYKRWEGGILKDFENQIYVRVQVQVRKGRCPI